MQDKYGGLERAALGTGGQAAPTAGTVGFGRIQIAQAQLKAHGMDPGHAPNGQLTPGTTSAIMKFQHSKGLSVTGTLDARTAQALAKPPKTAGRTVGSRRMKGGPILVKQTVHQVGNKANNTATHTRAGQGSSHMQNRTGPHPTSSAIGIGLPRQSTVQRPSLGSHITTQKAGSPPASKGAISMQGSSEWTSAGKRVPLIFQSTGTVAAGATVTIPVQPQIAFRGENFVVDSTTAAFFSVVSFKVGVPDQNAGGSGNIPCSIYAPTQNGALDYEMDLADAGTIIQLTVINNDTAAHSFIGTLWGHEIVQG
jgi:peptidoglycan hydrolase-like protein with peptidoglycan-binding domain